MRIWRLFLALLLMAAAPVRPEYDVVRPGTAITLPRDHGAHPGFRTEWWYVTGWLRTPDGGERGFQITFFEPDRRSTSATQAPLRRGR